MSPEHRGPEEERPRFMGDLATLESRLSEAVDPDLEEEVMTRLLAMGLEEESAGKFQIAIREALINAVAYGNLGLVKTPGVTLGDYAEELEALAAKPENAAKKATLELRACMYEGKPAVQAVVSDEGKGFDRKNVPDPIADENLLNTAGRGILMMEKFCDRVEFSPGKVVLTKMIDKKENPPENDRPAGE